MANSSKTSIADWIAFELAEDRPERFFEAVVDELVRRGVPVGRCAAMIRTPHPTIMGRTFRWKKGDGFTVSFAPTEAKTDDRFLLSPVYKVFEHGDTVRRRICDGEGLDEFVLMRELADEGATDYLAFPLTFIGGEHHALTWACYEPGGFSDDDIDLLLSIRVPFSRYAQIFALGRTAENLLNAFVGPGTGSRIFQGRYHLGDSDLIHAVVCFCDLRGSTVLAEHYGMEGFLAELNKFYACTAGAIQESGGEILRFIGDAFLAIFPTETFGGDGKACEAALAAAQNAIARLELENLTRNETGEPLFAGGFGLHIGDVLYGNIGIPDRLEFTVIGATANEAARIEGMCRETGESILVSQRFSSSLARDWRTVGEFELRNVSRKMTLFAP